MQVGEDELPARRTNEPVYSFDNPAVLYAHDAHGAGAIAGVVRRLEIDRREGVALADHKPHDSEISPRVNGLVMHPQ